MEKVYPDTIRIPCFNESCNYTIVLSLHSSYYRNKEYAGWCPRCGIFLHIDKFSPFLEPVTANTNLNLSGNDVLFTKVIKIGKKQ